MNIFPIENIGCPETAEAPELDFLPTVSRNIQFEFNKAILTFESQNWLDQTGKYFQSIPHVRISVSGHTDNVGSDRYNMKLSKKRAKAVKKYLVDRGIAKDRFELHWFGKSDPINPADPDPEKAKAQNRRVEIKELEN